VKRHAQPEILSGANARGASALALDVDIAMSPFWVL
jgi:hypothetical protein